MKLPLPAWESGVDLNRYVVGLGQAHQVVEA